MVQSTTKDQAKSSIYQDFHIELPLDQFMARSKYVKIVTTAKGPTDTATILALYSRAARTNLVAFAMGDSGKISRLLCLYLGSPFTYVALGKPTAPGQFSAKQLSSILKK